MGRRALILRTTWARWASGAWVAMAMLATSNAALAQFTPLEVEQAPNLPALVAQLGAQSAQPSSHLALQLPDVALPGLVEGRVRSELPGTDALVLVRGQFAAAAAAQPANLSPPPTFARPRGGEAPPPAPPAVWIASESFKAGERAAMPVKFQVQDTSTFTLFAHAQGKWWFVTREVKVGTAPGAAPASKTPR